MTRANCSPLNWSGSRESQNSPLITRPQVTALTLLLHFFDNPLPVKLLTTILAPSPAWVITTATRPPYATQLTIGQRLNPTLTNSIFISDGESDEIGGFGLEGRRRWTLMWIGKAISDAYPVARSRFGRFGGPRRNRLTSPEPMWIPNGINTSKGSVRAPW